jgi:hypothetical protein
METFLSSCPLYDFPPGLWADFHSTHNVHWRFPTAQHSYDGVPYIWELGLFNKRNLDHKRKLEKTESLICNHFTWVLARSSEWLSWTGLREQTCTTDWGFPSVSLCCKIIHELTQRLRSVTNISRSFSHFHVYFMNINSKANRNKCTNAILWFRMSKEVSIIASCWHLYILLKFKLIFWQYWGLNSGPHSSYAQVIFSDTVSHFLLGSSLGSRSSYLWPPRSQDYKCVPLCSVCVLR